ncbi:MAG: RtcB family protein [Campylobacter sp.]|nr:RtcB family protein [Campylobacter sp.]
MKHIKIYAEILEQEALEQFQKAMELKCNVAGALMSDAHTGYTLPIGAVVKSYRTIFPAYVGYDIGCGMCAIKFDITANGLDLEKIKNDILASIPVGIKKQEKAQIFADMPACTDMAKEIFDKLGKYQLGTLGGGNHFLELGVGSDKKVWAVVHSGSRGFGKKIAEHYMKEAFLQSINLDELKSEFEAKNVEFKKHNPEKFALALQKFMQKSQEKLAKTSIEGHFGLDIASPLGKNYIMDMNCALEFALQNRKNMIAKIKTALGVADELMFINKNHNHAIINGDFIIHRKGATSAELGEYGVIPGNMRDGSFIVRGLGNANSLQSSSHGAGRVMSRNVAKKSISLDELNADMVGIITNHTEQMCDEAPRAYKNIFEVMKAQSELVEIIEHIKPILNIKG